eukprot:jgi/Chrzof1/4748/Cz14g24240.t1_UROS1[v5.2]
MHGLCTHSHGRLQTAGRLTARNSYIKQRHVQCRAEPPKVVVTREKGKNDKLIKSLAVHNIHCVELPLIEHAPGPDRDVLPAVLSQGGFDWVAVTSPESAAVFIEGWNQAGQPHVRVAVVGGGTREVLEQAGIQAQFTATKATGKVMGAELPHVPGGDDVVLYPASLRASTDLQDSLTGSGFSVKRINTYDTVPVSDVPPELLQEAMAADIITFGSPSAVKAWVSLVGLEAAQAKHSVCIGATSAKACKSAGLTKVLYPEDPGIEGWVASILQALGQPQQAVAHSVS